MCFCSYFLCNLSSALAPPSCLLLMIIGATLCVLNSDYSACLISRTSLVAATPLINSSSHSGLVAHNTKSRWFLKISSRNFFSNKFWTCPSLLGTALLGPARLGPVLLGPAILGPALLGPSLLKTCPLGTCPPGTCLSGTCPHLTCLSRDLPPLDLPYWDLSTWVLPSDFVLLFFCVWDQSSDWVIFPFSACYIINLFYYFFAVNQLSTAKLTNIEVI